MLCLSFGTEKIYKFVKPVKTHLVADEDNLNFKVSCLFNTMEAQWSKRMGI